MQILKKIFIFILFIILYRKFTVQEQFYGWIPTSTRSTRNMIYDLRGHPIFGNKRIQPYRNKGYRGPFIYGLYPYWHLSPHHPFADYRLKN